MGRPDNGQDEGHVDCFEVCQGHPVSDWERERMAAVPFMPPIASARPGAGKQQRDVVGRWLRDQIRQPSGSWDTLPPVFQEQWRLKADELLALLAHTDEETR